MDNQKYILYRFNLIFLLNGLINNSKGSILAGDSFIILAFLYLLSLESFHEKHQGERVVAGK